MRAILVLLLAAFAASAAEGVLEISITPEQSVVRPWERVLLRVRMTNRSGRELVLVGPQDGSERGVRYPHCVFEIKDGGGRLEERLYRRPVDKVVNPLAPSAFFTLKPGESAELYPGGYDLAEHVDLGSPAVHHVAFRYSTMGSKESEWYGSYSDDYWDGERRTNEFWKKREPAMRQNRALLAKLSRLSQRSESVRIEVAGGPVSREEALGIAERAAGRAGWPWVKPSVTDKGAHWDVMTNSMSLGANGFFRIDKRTGRVVDQHRTGP